MKKIAFVDLYAQYQSIKEDIDTAITNTIASSSYIGGQSVKDFEQAFATYLGVKNVIACGNGTDSLEILLQTFGIKKGDEVIVPAASWISSSEAVSAVGATPVFVDIEPDFYTIDAALIEKAITDKTKCIIPVHLYGHPADMPAIMKIAEKHNLIVIEDCAQAHGAKVGDQLVGSFGHASSFSFYPGKNLGAYGDAGCMATNDDAIAETARMIANHGQKGKHNHQMEGRNSRLDGLQAAILLAKLPHLEKWTEARILNATMYTKHLEGASLSVPVAKSKYRHVYHLYVVRCENRQKVQDKLNTQGIETAIHYPTALPFLPCYSTRGFLPSDFPVAYSYQNKVLSLPMFAELTEPEVEFISSQLKS